MIPPGQSYNMKADFPILKRKINGKPIVYLDSASTSQKPQQVLNAMQDYYKTSNANIHRGVYTLSEEATEQYEAAHTNVAGFISASPQEIIFTRNTTESINLVAYVYGQKNITRGDNLVVSIMEHHSNFVPWQQLCKRNGAELRVIDIDDRGNLNMEQLNKLIDRNTKLIALTHVSNVLGTINNIREIADIAHDRGALLLVDGAQSVPHSRISVKKLKCDFLAFSGHKMLGPTGIGVLWGREELLTHMDPFLYGGDMIKSVTKEKTTWNDLPWKFEAGTPNIAGGIGLSAAIDYLKEYGMENVASHEKKLTQYATQQLRKIRGISFYGKSDNDNSSHDQKAGIISFNINDIHAHDIASIAAADGVCIRAGHHCCQPLMSRLNTPATARASFYIYNTKEDIDALHDSLEKARKVFHL